MRRSHDLETATSVKISKNIWIKLRRCSELQFPTPPLSTAIYLQPKMNYMVIKES